MMSCAMALWGLLGDDEIFDLIALGHAIAFFKHRKLPHNIHLRTTQKYSSSRVVLLGHCTWRNSRCPSNIITL